MQTVLFSLLVAVAIAPGCWAGTVNAPPAPKASSPTYTMLANYTGQWTLSMSKSIAGGAWVPHVCNASAHGAACNQPPLVAHSNAALKITFSQRNTSVPLKTWKNGVPLEVVIRLDYAPASQIDRGWRKKNQAYPGHGWHAKWTIAHIPFTTSGEAVWDLTHADEVTDAMLYPEICVKCTFADGSVDYCACDRRNGATNMLTVETAVEGSITPGMRGAAIALSIFSPMFLIFYSVGDIVYYKRTGRSLRLGHA
ncbi:hypothetical protein GPECTOR_20g413 [Gonium pectorale]|uniref:Uncharacterized protein n=1 Tax=Gonium pectorale TaxID=33097 RepID=A0A150GIC5_GONPE|nr:hypothetical protein GPECTOR_20g413 [Gonium pectorale]|eukprot:KXZ49559.1 hypothetical protein GPECTOR_20g413 [Gonium pectorale]